MKENGFLDGERHIQIEDKDEGKGKVLISFLFLKKLRNVSLNRK